MIIAFVRLFYDDMHNKGQPIKVQERDWDKHWANWRVAETSEHLLDSSAFAFKCKLICFLSVHLSKDLLVDAWEQKIQRNTPQLTYKNNLEGPELDLDSDDDLAVSKPLCLKSCSIDTAIISAW